MAALRLCLQNVDVRIIDQHDEVLAQSFPVVLHPQSLRLLSEVGLSPTLLWQGRAVGRLALYTDFERRAVLSFPARGTIPAGLMTLPRDALRRALANELARRGVRVEHGVRLASLEQDAGSITGQLERREPGSEPPRARPTQLEAFEADFLIGADGYDSTTRAALGIELKEHGKLETFAFFDAPSGRGGQEAQLALGEEHIGSIYPLHYGSSRFSFQISRSLDQAPNRDTLKELLFARMPWYAEEPPICEWAGVAEFRRALATHFGVGRAWLAGEAAHLSGPLGVQSLNVGLDEATELADRIAHALQEPLSPNFGAHYEAKRMRQWRALLGLDVAVPSERSPEWARKHAPRLLPCLPASGVDLDDLLDQLRLSPRTEPPAWEE